MPGEDGTASWRGQCCSGSPGLRPAIAGIVRGHFERSLAIGKQYGVEKIPLIELTGFKQLTEQACLAPCNVAFDTLGDAGLSFWDVKPKQTASVLVLHLLADAHGVKAVVSDPGNGRIPSLTIGTFSLHPEGE